MTVRRTIVERVASVRAASVGGAFFRHASPNRDAFAGGYGGRWGKSFPVIYLGRPEESAVVEAYRHLVESAGVPAHMVKPRVLYSVSVVVDDVLDLRARTALEAVGLTDVDLTTQVDDYDRCQEVESAAHQLGLHGILAPAAHGLGETLALFRERLTPQELPVIQGTTVWQTLPPDPRVLRPVRGQAQTGA